MKTRLILLSICAFLQGCVILPDGTTVGVTFTLPTKQAPVKAQK